MGRLLQINPVLRTSTSTGRIMQEIGDVAMAHGWESWVAYSYGRDGIKPCTSGLLPVGGKADVALHGLRTRLADAHGLGSAAATRRLVADIRRLQPDVIHLHNIHGYFLNYGILFDYLSRSGIPVVWTIHDCWMYTGHCFYYTAAGCDRWKTHCHDCPQRGAFPASWLADRSARNFDDKRHAFTSMPHDRLTIVPVSEWIRREMADSFMKDYPFRVIPNGIDTDVFRPRDDKQVRERYNLEDKKILLAVASIWTREKGLEDLKKVASMLQPGEVLVLVGALREAAGTLPAGVVTVERTENPEELAALYAAASVLLNPTWQDNYPTVNMEAVASGTPVVTYRTGGSPEALTPETGAVVAPGDVSGMLAEARRFAGAGRDACREACRARALACFRKQDRYEEYIHLYENITAR